MNGLSRFACCLILLLVVGCAAKPTGKSHTRFQGVNPAPLPKKLVLLPADIKVREVSAGGVVEDVPDWGRQATGAVMAVMDDSGGPAPLPLVRMPSLTAEEEAILAEHLALLQVLGKSALQYSSGQDSAWRHKADNFDYTVGDGLRFLRERSGADGAVVMVGEDYVTTTGRKVMGVAAAAFGVTVPLGRSYMIGCVIDLQDGDVLWLHSSASEGLRDLRNQNDARAMVKAIFEGYPGSGGGRP